MILFSKDKGIVFKITNAILLLWLIGASLFAITSIIRLAVPEPRESYLEYKSDYCYYPKQVEEDTLTSEEIEELCQNDYDSQKDRERYEKLITLYTSLANVVIIGGVLFFINRKKTS